MKSQKRLAASFLDRLEVFGSVVKLSPVRISIQQGFACSMGINAGFASIEPIYDGHANCGEIDGKSVARLESHLDTLLDTLEFQHWTREHLDDRARRLFRWTEKGFDAIRDGSRFFKECRSSVRWESQGKPLTRTGGWEYEFGLSHHNH